MTSSFRTVRHPLPRTAGVIGLAAVTFATAACRSRPWPPVRTTTTVAPATTTTTAPAPNAVSFALGSATNEFVVTLTQGTIKAGSNVITTTNVGRYQHEIIFIQAESAASLPRKANGAVDMALVPAANVAGDHHTHLAGGQSATQTVTFRPGRWVALCNIEHEGSSHFANGQFIEFTVT
jgi:hypothetical protein